MAVVIAAPASGSGKTLLSLVLLAWARSKGLTIQPFKVGPDYLDPQLLSATAILKLACPLNSSQQNTILLNSGQHLPTCKPN